MDIIHLSDTHSHQDKVKVKVIPCDILIHTGDFCNIDFSLINNRENSAAAEKLSNFTQAVKFLNWVEAYPARYKIITSGNHETFLNDIDLRTKFELMCKEKNVIFKDTVSEIIEIEGLKIAGAGSYPKIADYMTSKHAYFHNEGFYSQIPDEPIDILLSHVPPEVSGNQFECPDLEYWLRERIKDGLSVPLVLCGHVHETKGTYTIGGLTKVINSSYEFKPNIIVATK